MDSLSHSKRVRISNLPTDSDPKSLPSFQVSQSADRPIGVASAKLELLEGIQK